MTPDIEARIAADFSGDERDEARAILGLLEDELVRLDSPRILRCVLFLSRREMTRLVYYSDRALQDYRDVLHWAEYDEQDRRLRDLNESFHAS